MALPFSVQAYSCSENGYSVIFLNGIFSTEKEANENKDALVFKLGEKFGAETITYKVGYNQTHLAGVGDIIETKFPVFDQYDLDTILMQMHADVTTRKILLVGHSQGSVYANKIYEYLTTHGVPAEDIAVYTVATPDSYVAGSGGYISYTLDGTIQVLAKQFGLSPLPANATFLEWFNSTDNDGSPPQGHSFIDMYLGGFGTRMVQEMRGELAGLQTKEVTAKDGCFDPPESTLGYKAAQAGFGIADPVVGKIGVGLQVAGKTIATVGSATVAAVGAIGNIFNSVANAVTPTPRTTNLPGSHDVVSAIYGSSVTEENLREFGLLEDQGGAVALAVANKGEVKGVETEKPAEPAALPPIPPPGGFAVPSPGFGGGGGSSPVAAATTPEETGDTPVDTVPTTTPSAPPDPVPPPPDPLPPLPEPVVPDGTPPSVATVTINGTALPQLSSFATTPVATTTTTWSTVITFDEDISVPPAVKDGTQSFDFTNGIEQAVGDCSDADAKTFCFTYVPPPSIEAAVFWFFRIAGAQDISGETLASTTYRFIVDTAGPILTLDVSATNNILPTLSGTSSYTQAAIELLLNGVQYFFGSPNGAWSFAVQPGDELAEGSYPIVATSIDQNNNTVTHHWALTVDLTKPVLAITSGPSEGDSVASTSPVGFEFSATDATELAYVCTVDGVGTPACVSPYSSMLAPGAHSFVVVATDAAGNAASTARNFTVLP